MAVIIVGIEASYGSCSSLMLLERTLYTGNPCQENALLEPGAVAERALLDADLDGADQLGSLSSAHPQLADLSPGGIQPTRIGTIAPESGSIYQSIQIADRWIQEDPGRVVLLTITSDKGTGSLLLAHPSRDIPAYVLIDISIVDPIEKLFTELPQDTPENIPVGYLELFPGISKLDQNDFSILDTIVESGNHQPDIALGSVYNQIPDESGLASLIHASLVISRKIIPQYTETLGDKLPSGSAGNLFYLPEENRPWLSRGNGYQRTALLVNMKGHSSGWKALLINEPKTQKILPAIRSTLKKTEPILIPLAGTDLTALQNEMRSFEADLQGSTGLNTLANNAYAKLSKGQNPGFICSLMGSTREEFQKELTHATKGVQQAFNSTRTWSSPKGSYFTPQPLGEQGLAFVYPGAFNSYPGMARELFDYFPDLHHLVKRTIQNISQSLAEDFLYSKDNFLDPDPQREILKKKFSDHPIELIESGISFSVLHTLLLKDLFQISPDAAFGYSLGEISMLWANNIWQDAEESSKQWRYSSLFKTQLVGPMYSVRNYWTDNHLEEDFWGSYILKAPVEEVNSVVAKEPQVFLTIINTPNEVVIAGKHEACQKVIAKLACHALPIPYSPAIHNPAMHSNHPDFVDLYTHQVQEHSKIRFYSAADYGALTIDTNILSESMAKMTCNPVDFPKLVEKVYQDGVRIFIEVGPQKTCSRWIEKILGSQPHAVIPINKKHQPDFDGVLKVLGLLLSHQVPLDLSQLYTEAKFTSQTKKRGNGNGAAVIGPLEKMDLESNQDPRSIHHRESHFENQPIPIVQSKYLANLDRLSADTADSRRSFLANQQTLTRNLVKVLQLQLGSPSSSPSLDQKPAPLFSTEQIVAFTVGDHRICFGTTYAEFGDSRIPRLPNGELRFIDRVIEVQGQAEEVIIGSSLVSEFDIPPQAWYLKDPESTLPYVSLMEAALQPCGFLSAYMGSIKNKASHDLYFRNLDGKAALLSWPNLAGETITNRVELISSSTLQNVIIQDYSFELSIKGNPFYSGNSSFGYFTEEMLIKQAGLDNNQNTTSWQVSNPDSGEWIEVEPGSTDSRAGDKAQLPIINRVWFSPIGGAHGKGYLYLNQPIDPSSWFYQAHFYQDPVMPGSLGVETMAQALIKSAKFWEIPETLRWRVKPELKTIWKYRGQITREITQVGIELHIKSIETENQQWQIIADGNLWNGEVRIYHINDLALETY